MISKQAMDIEKTNDSLKAIKELIGIVSKLRCPEEGCPWDQEQTHKSLIPYVIEEAYEVTDAIRNESDDELKEELGDLLLQIILHAEIACEEKRFTIEDIARELTKKLIRRHPHIFNTKKKQTVKEVQKNWESIKLKEKNLKNSKHPISDTLKKKIRGQSPIKGALEISNKTASLGFDWENIDDVWRSVEEEFSELKKTIHKKDFSNAQEELGDLIFSLVNIARWLKISPEEGLVGTNKRFLNRFSHIESTLEGNFANQSLNKLQNIWESTKATSESNIDIN